MPTERLCPSEKRHAPSGINIIPMECWEPIFGGWGRHTITAAPSIVGDGFIMMKRWKKWSLAGYFSDLAHTSKIPKTIAPKLATVDFGEAGPPIQGTSNPGWDRGLPKKFTCRPSPYLPNKITSAADAPTSHLICTMRSRYHAKPSNSAASSAFDDAAEFLVGAVRWVGTSQIKCVCSTILAV